MYNNQMMGGGGMMMGGGGGMMMGQQQQQPQQQPQMMMGGGAMGPPPYNMQQWNPPVNANGVWMCLDKAIGQWRQYFPNFRLWFTQQEWTYISSCPPQQQQAYLFQFQQQQAWFMNQGMNMGMGMGMNQGMGMGMNQGMNQPQPRNSNGIPSPTSSGGAPGNNNNNKLLWTPDKLQQLSSAENIDAVSALFEGCGWDTAAWQYAMVLSDEKGDVNASIALNMAAANFTQRVVPSKMDLYVNKEDLESGGLEEYQVAVVERDFDYANRRLSPAVNNTWVTKAPPSVLAMESTATETIAAPDESRRRYEFTEVRVGNMATLDLAKQLKEAFQQERVAVLNMTHPKHPGGEWLKGNLSQEETNFVQSCLSASLDEEDYPLEDFALRYSKDVPIIREGPGYGFSFLPDDQRWSVDFVSICGINLSKKGAAGASQFTAEIAVRTRAKIEALLSACVANGASILVLGALGCGAFCNPPEYVAGIFKAVLEQYAGFFRRVYFAIISGEPAPGRETTNMVFSRVLVGPNGVTSEVESIQELEPAVARYPHPPPDWRMPTTDVTKPLCECCGCCTDYTPEHRAAHCHPPECPAGINCQNADKIHHQMFAHRQQDERNGLITRGPEKQQQQDTMSGGGAGGSMGMCPAGTTCKQLFDREHLRSFGHPFLPPCPRMLECTDMSREHLSQHSHLCPNGNMCSALGDASHCRYFVHAGTMCMNPQCSDVSEEHLRAFMHPGAPAVRPPCPAPWCSDYSLEHRRKFAHQPYARIGNSGVRMLNSRDPSSSKAYGDFSSSKDYAVDFVEGTSHWLECLARHPQGALPADSRNVRDVMGWMRNFRPVNMCSANSLKSVARLGIVGSSVRLQNLWALREDIVDSVLARKAIRDLCPWDHNAMKRTRKYLKKYIRVKQGELGTRKANEYKAELAKLASTGTGSSSNTTNNNNNVDDEFKRKLENLQKLINTYQGTPLVAEAKQGTVSEARMNLVSYFNGCGLNGDAIVGALEAEVPTVLDAIVLLLGDLGGVNFKLDEKVCTNHTVFAIVGPHMDNYGGAEVTLIFNKTIMYHPDYYMLPNAATLYAFGQYHKAKYKYGPEMNRVAWMGPSKPFEGGGREALRTEKFHPIDPRWEEAAAKEFIFQTAQNTGKRPADVTLPDVVAFWKKSNSHCVIEGHLPSSVTLDYVEYAILQRKAYDELIRAGGDAAALVREWESRPGFLKIVENAQQAKEENAGYFARCPPRDEPKGFTFVISGADTKELFMPYRMSETADVVTVRFGALGGKFFATVSNIGDILSGEVERKTITFGLNKEMTKMSAYYSAPANCVAERAPESTEDFSIGCDTNDFVNYAIVIDYKARTATIKHDGHSAEFNNKAVTVPLKEAQRYSYISFSSPINEEPRPRIINLNFSYN